MSINFDNLSTPTDRLRQDARPASTLGELQLATEALRAQPVISLAQAIEQLGLLSPGEIGGLMRESPEMLRSQSQELVRRLLLTPEDFSRHWRIRPVLWRWMRQILSFRSRPSASRC